MTWNTLLIWTPWNEEWIPIAVPNAPGIMVHECFKAIIIQSRVKTVASNYCVWATLPWSRQTALIAETADFQTHFVIVNSPVDHGSCMFSGNISYCLYISVVGILISLNTPIRSFDWREPCLLPHSLCHQFLYSFPSAVVLFADSINNLVHLFFLLSSHFSFIRTLGTTLHQRNCYIIPTLPTGKSLLEVYYSLQEVQLCNPSGYVRSSSLATWTECQ